MSPELQAAVAAYQAALQAHDANLTPQTHDRLTKALAALGDAAETENLNKGMTK